MIILQPNMAETYTKSTVITQQISDHGHGIPLTLCITYMHNVTVIYMLTK